MKKSILVVTIILLLSLLATSTVSAGMGPKPPIWEQVFTPQTYIGENVNARAAAVFKGALYYLFYGPTTGDQIWVTKNGKDWSFAWDPNSIQEGCDVIDYLSEFKGKLYLTLACPTEWNKKQIMRTSDGQTWEEVAYIEDTAEVGTWYSGGFASFQGSLYVGRCTAFPDGVDCRLLRSINGDPGTWEEVMVLPGWEEIASFYTFKGALYVSSWFASNGVGAEVWRSFDGLSWEPVTLDGFGDEGNIATWSFGQKDRYLYLGMGNGNGGQIWRTKDGMDWQPVNQDGLGDPSNLAFGFVTYQKMLYAYSLNLDEGCRVYASRDGILYTPVNEPGWGDPVNNMVRSDIAWVIFKGALYMGVSDFFGSAPGGVFRLGPPVKGLQ
jgi:hypothetical protein